MKQRILLTGKNGQLGFELQRALAPLGEVVAVDIEECDFADTDAIRTLVRRIRPRVIVNPAAHTAIDKAETEIALATAINTHAPGILGAEAARIGAWVLHYSTDYVFDGEGSRPYVETDATHPLNIYGKTKRDGELALQDSGAQHLILRTSWITGAHGGNFARTVLDLAAQEDTIKVVDDQFGSPTSASLLADLTAQLIEQVEQGGEEDFPFGLYHVVASGETHRCDYARFVVAEALAAGAKLKLMPENIQPVSMADYLLPARRPRHPHLDTEKFRTTFGLPLPDWQTGVRQTLRQIFRP